MEARGRRNYASGASVHACARVSQDMQLTGNKRLQKSIPPPPTTHTETQPPCTRPAAEHTKGEKKKKHEQTYTKPPVSQCPMHRCVLKCHVQTHTHTPAHTYTLPLHSKYTHSPTHMKNKHSHKIHPHMKTNAHSLDLTHTYSALLPHQSVCLTETHLYVRHFLWGKWG